VSRFFFWVDEKPRTCYWRAHPQGANWSKVYLDDEYVGQIFRSTSGGWGAIVDHRPGRRGESIGHFRTRWDATQYMLWAQGMLAKDDRPFA